MTMVSMYLLSKKINQLWCLCCLETTRVCRGKDHGITFSSHNLEYSIPPPLAATLRHKKMKL